MRRFVRFVLASIVALPGLLGASLAQAEIAASVPASAAPILERAEEALTSFHSLQARFLQVSSNGGSSEGTVKIRRPGRMRLEYDPPADILLVADGTWMILVDTTTGQPTNVPLGSTPAGILLRDDLSFEDQDILVKAVRQANEVAEIDVVQKQDPDAGMLTFVFSMSPMELRQWKVKDAQGVETSVSLFDIRTGVSFKNEDFVYVQVPGQKR